MSTAAEQTPAKRRHEQLGLLDVADLPQVTVTGLPVDAPMPRSVGIPRPVDLTPGEVDMCKVRRDRIKPNRLCRIRPDGPMKPPLPGLFAIWGPATPTGRTAWLLLPWDDAARAGMTAWLTKRGGATGEAPQAVVCDSWAVDAIP